MTLVGMLPPLCDNGGMLVDGGYLDNLPVCIAIRYPAARNKYIPRFQQCLGWELAQSSPLMSAL
jgi:hypothetical protein